MDEIIRALNVLIVKILLNQTCRVIFAKILVINFILLHVLTSFIKKI